MSTRGTIEYDDEHGIHIYHECTDESIVIEHDRLPTGFSIKLDKETVIIIKKYLLKYPGFWK